MTTPVQPPDTVPHLRLPVALTAGGSLATVEQDTLDEVTQCVAMLLGTPMGSRPVVPDYGLADPTFIGLDPGSVQAAVSTWEPRATVDITTDPTGESPIVAVSLAAQ